MVLQPLILVLVVDEVGQEFPVFGGLFASLNDEVIALVAEVRHRLHVDDLALNMHQLLEAQRIRLDGNLGILYLKHAFQLRRDKLDSIGVGAFAYEIFGLIHD